MGTRIGKLMWILVKIAIMGLIMTGIILINKKYMSDADGSEKVGQKTSIERVINLESLNSDKVKSLSRKRLSFDSAQDDVTPSALNDVTLSGVEVLSTLKFLCINIIEKTS